ncbi:MULTISPECIES: hypothetical protein [Symbiopectobacterium]|uniref:hypothetical protein n=1 Tax=Symbiopectobacterium TaxID=801 RepID=UPI001A183E7C|nr:MULTISPECIES: hypothetical protein [Symbiopectobacterium]MBG6247668.1 hypothetical protein [Candidatus Symbiopectobacterium sp. PLON1]MBT9429797.1 hypothetical protein [Candidatus Symbiopectobacterium endolongispinus]
MLPSGSVVGALLPSIAAQVGRSAGIPVITAGGDQQCCALGIGQFASDRVIVNVGTCAYVMGMATTLGTAPLDNHFAYNHAALPTNIVIEGALLSASCAYDWFNRTFYQADGDYHTINQEVSAALPGGYGLVLSPFFKGKLIHQPPGEVKAFFYDIALHHTRGGFRPRHSGRNCP